MNNDKNMETPDKIIKTHMMISMGAGLVPLPLLDVVAVTAVQVDMLKQLSSHYNIPFSEQAGKSWISAIGGSVLARMGASTLKAIPVIGSILGGVTMAALSGASTYALGNVFKMHFKNGGDLSDIDVDKAKDYFKVKFDEGKKMAKEMDDNIDKKMKSDSNDAGGPKQDKAKSPKSFVEQLENLAQMKEDGLLTQEEFETLKKKIMERAS